MSIRDEKRFAALDRIADHMLTHGLAPSSLRALAAASGTSDRMLLYYFADKDELVIAALQVVSLRLADLLLDSLGESKPSPPAALFLTLSPVMRGESLRPYMRLWLELSVLASRGEEPFLTVAGQIADSFLLWVASRLDVHDERARLAEAATLIALVDGMVLLDLAGRPESSDAILERRRSHPI